MMRLPGPPLAVLVVVLLMAACADDVAEETSSTAAVGASTSTIAISPCQMELGKDHFEIDLDGVPPSESVYVLHPGAPGSETYEIGLCIDGDFDSSVRVEAEAVSVAGFVDLDDDGRKEVILQTTEGEREVTRAMTSTLRGLAATTLAAESWIDDGGDSPPVDPFTGEAVECQDYDGDGSPDLLVVDYRPAEDLVHIDVAVVDLTDRTTAVEVGVDSYEADVATAFDRWTAPLSCEATGDPTSGLRYGANGWARVDYGESFDSRGDLVLTAVAHGGGQFVAVGYEQPSRLIGEYFETQQTLWHSTDGLDWTRSTVEEPGELRDVIALSGTDRFLAIGQTGSGTAAVWTSSRGDAWELIEVDPAVEGGSARMLGVSEGADGVLVAVGVETYPPDPSGPGPDLDAAVWWSDDGQTWHRIEDPALGDLGYQPNNDGEFNGEIVDVAYAPGSGYMAVGSASRTGDDQIDFPTQYPAVWASPDGSSWERRALDREVRLRGVAVVGGSWVAYGVSTLHGSPTQDAVILVSGDGMSWTEAGGDFAGIDATDGVQSINDVVELPGGSVLAVGSDEVEFEAKGAAAAWRASIDDLGKWVREEHDADVFEEVAESPAAVMTDGTWSGGQLLVVGFSGESQVLDNGAIACCVFRPAIWFWGAPGSPP